MTGIWFFSLFLGGWRLIGIWGNRRYWGNKKTAFFFSTGLQWGYHVSWERYLGDHHIYQAVNNRATTPRELGLHQEWLVKGCWCTMLWYWAIAIFTPWTLWWSFKNSVYCWVHQNDQKFPGFGGLYPHELSCHDITKNEGLPFIAVIAVAFLAPNLRSPWSTTLWPLWSLRSWIAWRWAAVKLFLERIIA